ncbi:MAG TPA: hypothetical protein VF856_07415 [Gemmatimonadaceae bacterium]
MGRHTMRIWKWIGIGLGGLVLATFIGLCVMAGGVRDAYGMLRYALPHMHRGNLRVGEDAPDARLVTLDGVSRFHLRERVGKRPLVLIFGSYT